MFFAFPEDARWNPDRDAIEFGIIIGEYEGLVRVSRQVFRRLLDGAATPERCIEAYHLQRTRFELVAERKLRQRQLTDDGNVEIGNRDLRTPSVPPAVQRPRTCGSEDQSERAGHLADRPFAAG
jgi:hypothetical protein